MGDIYGPDYYYQLSHGHRSWKKGRVMGFEDMNSATGGEKNEKKDIHLMEPLEIKDELRRLSERITELSQKDGRGEEEVRELDEIIERSKEIIEYYEEKGYFPTGKETANPSQMSSEAETLMKRGGPYTAEEKDLLLSESDRLDERATKIMKNMNSDDYPEEGWEEIE
jgi:hypothetical protein